MSGHERKAKKDRKPIDMSDALLAWAESSKARMEASLVKAERYNTKSNKDLINEIQSDLKGTFA